MVNTQKIEDELNDDIQLAENIEIDDNYLLVRLLILFLYLHICEI